MRVGTAGLIVIFAVAAFLVCCLVAEPKPAERISVVVNEQERRVDIAIDGKPFTSYIWPTTLKKPVLYPLRTAKGTVVTRGYPLEQRAGERVDHPHHLGLWFNYENVNGLDFWNNSYAIPAAKKGHYGWIKTDKVSFATFDSSPSGGKPNSHPSVPHNSEGVLHYSARWTNQQGETLLN